MFEEPGGVGSPVVFSEIGDRTMVFDGRWKMAVNSGGEILELFDLAEDPAESLNLAGRSDMPDIARRLQSELLRFRLKTDDRQFREVNS